MVTEKEKTLCLDSLDYIIEVAVKFIDAKSAKVKKQGIFKIGVRDFNPQTGKVYIVGFPERETTSRYLNRVIELSNFAIKMAKHAKWLAQNQKKGAKNHKGGF